MRRLRLLLVGSLGLVLVSALVAWWQVGKSVETALRAADPERRPLQFLPVAARAAAGPRWGGADVEAVAFTPAGLVAAGGSGVFDASGDLGNGLPTLKATALALWRGRLVVALAQGGVYVRNEDRWQELRTGWGALHSRVLAESEAGELLVGAREGLFRVSWGERSLERVDPHPVRAVSAAAGRILAGGEEGLILIEGRTSTRIETPDRWIEAVALTETTAWVVTATGLLRGASAADLRAVRQGDEVVTGAFQAGRFAALTETGTTLLRFDAAGLVGEEALPARARRLFEVEGELLADTSSGLLRRTPLGWRPALKSPAALPPGTAHVSALARLGDRVVMGLFDGGLLVGTPQGDGFVWGKVEGSAAWGVNALLPAGGVVWVASLRGAARFDGTRLEALPGPGAAFSLAATSQGVAIGYGQGVRLPDGRLLSAFHGLPGNQATALLPGPALVVGTPSGLGAIDAMRVSWRATSADGRLPHPWVTALASTQTGVFVGTYGGGVVRRASDGRFDRLVETDGLKVSAGALVAEGETLWLGSEGLGLLWRSRDGERFTPVPAALPSPIVTAILPLQASLLVGTSEGVALLSRGSIR